MSVFKRPGAEVYSYDFRLGGNRFSGSTGATTRREAERAEDRARAVARAAAEETKAASDLPMTFGAAADLYWSQVGQHLKGGNADGMLSALAWLKPKIGPARLLRDIDDRLVAELVATRRGEHSRSGGNRKRRKGAKRAAAPKLVSPATVNRTVIEPLRQILNRARQLWKQPVTEIAWRMHVLREPRERVRELRAEEEAHLFAVLRPDYHPALRFALITGLRLGEIACLRWNDVDWGGRQITVLSKGDKLATIPMPPDVRDLLWPLRGDHPEAVFTYEAARRRDGRTRGDMQPITRSGLQITFRRAVAKAGITNFRFHDNRHTAATRVLRATGNLKIVQRLLRHEQITTTAKYSHVLDDDVLAAMQLAAERGRAAQEAIATPTATKCATDETNIPKSEAS
ncbi:tyrosine-type recombinase/integrase [Methylobacterium sp. J-070]|uniref:tyrosine-type recombinase/integrase n=1 Tax=Methylobacterium sp. J-070 TaxID=2836650 RepID=UPI001FBB95D1|nr:site-specific integrase [Methylobacterium sp. J-070]MCJ2051654.1 site-specific integrase [Methylobacterium sp. J-070]